MTNEELAHYAKGGIFRAFYRPKTVDIPGRNLSQIGRFIEVHQNMECTPIVEPGRWSGQFRFNSTAVYGWFPEEDLDDLTIVNAFVDNPQKLPQFIYKMTYTEEEQLRPNFGNGPWKIPLVVERQFSVENDAYVLSLSSPQATAVEKAVWNGEQLKEVSWKILHSSRFDTLLEKRKNMTADVFEEEELIKLASNMDESVLSNVDKSLFTYTNSIKLARMSELLDKMIDLLDKK